MGNAVAKTKVITSDRTGNLLETPEQVLRRLIADLDADQYKISEIVICAVQNDKLHVYTSSPSPYGARGLLEAANRLL